MAKVWGFDLSEMHWSAFGSKEMMDPRYHLRKQRIIVYKIAMSVSLAAECTATYSLSKYNAHQSHIESYPFPLSPTTTTSPVQATENNESLIRAAISTIVFCVFVATVFGADFFFLLFFPRRRYPLWWHRLRSGAAVVVMLGVFASAVASTVVIATQEATIYGPGVTEEVRQQLIQAYARPPLRYRSWPQNIAWAVLVWLAFVLTAASTALLLRASAYDKRYGPEDRLEAGVAVESERERITPAPEKTTKGRRGEVGSEKGAVGV
ncbi:hypothetical protein DFP72DRAFT_1039482 [Ephemerocybe angulata]|uniref:Uncharacterized protein n=1 Tax=Ephemerocybe angulata TaxID=980116 RepID=A0A8H6IJN5_9AGAR|nr:hypothetical protein DFP72DRAFT_1039482 [Tulosesus angulatus]